MKAVNQIRMSAILMAAIFLFAGCEKEIDDTADNPPVAASINSAIIPLTSGPGSSGGSGSNAMTTTRAAGTAWAANDAIGITATRADGRRPLENAHYLTPGGDGTFTAADGSVFYFTDNAEVGFTAYYPWTAPEKLKNGIIQDVLTGATNQTPANQPKIDFLFATAKGSAASPDVRLQFRHCMSRLVLNFKPGEGIAALDDIEYWLSGIAVAGTFNPLTGETKAENIGIAISLTVPGNGAAELSSPLILFPQQGDDVRTLALTMRGTRYTATFQLPQNPQNNNVRELLAGHSYTYNVKINNTTMTISQATISDWSDGGSENIDSTN
ncbi:fimbrillin family protein [Parabacteroides pacaensis]|uniref:fimbrillin family protein n=1 Tax=Parabacteroides pacaensis TaxID=2086575 RepID=UPI000D0F7ABB|nr:fimbrillin family protein [Parabacteroides pacaensis]